MAREGLSYDELALQTGLDTRTLRGILRAEKQPRSITLKRLADGLGVSVDDLFHADESSVGIADFDAATNPAIEEAMAVEPQLFDKWLPGDFGELASRFGAGGPLTLEGVIESARKMNVNRETIERARVVLETDQRETLRQVIDALFERTRARD